MCYQSSKDFVCGCILPILHLLLEMVHNVLVILELGHIITAIQSLLQRGRCVFFVSMHFPDLYRLILKEILQLSSLFLWMWTLFRRDYYSFAEVSILRTYGISKPLPLSLVRNRLHEINLFKLISLEVCGTMWLFVEILRRCLLMTFKHDFLLGNHCCLFDGFQSLHRWCLFSKRSFEMLSWILNLGIVAEVWSLL